MRVWLRATISILFILFLILIQFAYWWDPITLSEVISAKEKIFLFIENYARISATIYIASYAASIIFGLPISATIIGGYFFGIRLGMWYSMIALIIGTIILTVFVRHMMRDWVQKKYAKQLEPFNKELNEHGVYYLFMIHAIPFIPSFLPNIATSISSTPLYKVIIISFLAALPLTFVYVVAGSYIHSLHSLDQFILYLTIFGALLAVPFIITTLYHILYRSADE